MVLSFEANECNHVADNNVEWVIDLAASYHATPIKEFFTSYKSGDLGTLKIENSSHSKIVGIGGICIEMSIGYTLILKDGRQIIDLQLNLISANTLDRLGYGNYFGSEKLKLT